MADAHLTLQIVDEGYYRKFFALSPTTNLKKLLDAYRGHLCPLCSRPNLLDFWYDTTQIQDGHTAGNLSMTTGDIIDVRISVPVTRGACPIPATQTQPNIHYLADPNITNTASNPTGIPSRFAAIQPANPLPTSTDKERITIQIKDQTSDGLTLRVKKSTPFRKILDAYARSAEKQPRECRMYLDGLRLGLEDTPGSVEMEEGDLVDVFVEQTGGGREQPDVAREGTAEGSEGSGEVKGDAWQAAEATQRAVARTRAQAILAYAHVAVESAYRILDMRAQAEGVSLARRKPLQ